MTTVALTRYSQIKLEPQKNYQSVARTGQTYFEKEGYGFLSACNKLLRFLGNCDLSSRLSVYIGACAIPTFLEDTFKLHNRFTKDRTGYERPEEVLEEAKDVFSWVAMGSYACSFIFKELSPLAGIGEILYTFSDASELGINALNAYEIHVLQMGPCSTESRDALESKFRYHLLKCIKAVIAAAGGVFAIAAVLGIVSLSATTLLVLSATASFFGILAFLQKNYYSETIAEIVHK
jgi:hypothetical protein